MVGVSAQVSLYPLRRKKLSPAINAALAAFRGHGLEVQPGPMSSIVTGDDEAVFAALREAFCRAAEQGEVVMEITLSNACPVTAD
jgi:uncharacterized protein YqgV (UPF0045/DUF77 family)